MGRTTHLEALVMGAALAAGIGMAAAPALALTNDEIARLKGADRQKILVEGAKKEGKTVLYTPINVDSTLRPMGAVFEKKYPGVKFEYWRGGTVEQMQKIGAEVRSKNQFADLTEGGTGATEMIKGGMAAAFASPSLDAYDKDHLDPKGLWAPSRVAYMGLAYNTKAFEGMQVPKSFDDLLNPSLKGKLVWVASTDAGAPLFIANTVNVMGQAKAEEYLKKLAGQNITVYPNNLSSMVGRVGQGEYALAIHAPAHDPIREGKKGAPLDTQMLDPIPGLINAIQLIKGAPHPHAAMLFLDYFLSEEGQNMMSNTGYMAVHPKVEPSPDLRKVVPRLAGMKEFVVTPERLEALREPSRELYTKYLDR